MTCKSISHFIEKYYSLYSFSLKFLLNNYVHLTDVKDFLSPLIAKYFIIQNMYMHMFVSKKN